MFTHFVRGRLLEKNEHIHMILRGNQIQTPQDITVVTDYPRIRDVLNMKTEIYSSKAFTRISEYMLSGLLIFGR